MAWLTNPGAVDIAILVVVAISGLLALARGFTKEVLALGAWVVAAVVTWYLFPSVRVIGREWIGSELVADGVSIAVVFIATLVVASIIGHPLAARIREGSLGAVDRWLGFAFGVVRGALIVTIAYVLASFVVTPAEQPAWLRNARLMPYVEEAGAWLMRIAPGAVRDQTVLANDPRRLERGNP